MAKCLHTMMISHDIPSKLDKKSSVVRYVNYRELLQKNCNISCQPKILSSLTMRQIPGITSLPPTLTAKKSTKMEFLVDKIFYNFSHEYPTFTDF